MALVFRSVATTTAGVSPRSVNKPAGVLEGDLLVLQVSVADNTGVITVSDGFTLIPGSTILGSPSVYLYWKVAGASEPSSYTVSTAEGTGPNVNLACLAIVSDVGLVYKTDGIATQSNASSTDRVWPSITTTEAATFFGCFGVIGSNTGTTPHTGMNERWDNSSIRQYLMTQSLASAGATGTRTGTGVAATSICVSVAFAETEDVGLDPITGTLAATLAALTLAATATASIAGTLAQTLAGLTLQAEGTVAEQGITGELDATLAALTLAATGSLPITGELNATLDALTVQASGAAISIIVTVGAVIGARAAGDVTGARAAGSVHGPKTTGTVRG